MKFIPIAITLIVASLLITSCSKDKDDKQKSCRVTAATVTGSGSTTSYVLSYDDQDRLASVQSTSGGSVDVSLFTYTNNVILITRATNGTIGSVDSIVLNGAGLLQYLKNRTVGSNDYSESVVTYNGNEVTTITSSSNGGSTNSQTAVFSGGNLSSIAYGSSISTYAYDTQHEFQPGDYLYFAQYSQYGCFYIKNKNVLQSTTSGSSTQQFNYTYDSDGRISGAQVISGSSISSLAYTYSCD